MVSHVVLFKFHSPVDAACDEARRRLLAMRARIPMLREIEVGRDVGGDPRAFDLCLITRFDTMAELDAYRVHPEHQAVVAYLKTVTEKSVVADYEA